MVNYRVVVVCLSAAAYICHITSTVDLVFTCSGRNLSPLLKTERSRLPESLAYLAAPLPPFPSLSL